MLEDNGWNLLSQSESAVERAVECGNSVLFAHGRTTGYSPSRRRSVALSQEISKRKRLWLKRILSGRAAKAMWLAPAFFSPLLLPTQPGDLAIGQQPPVEQVSAQSPIAPDAGFVLGWLEHASQQIGQGDSGGAARAFAEALRGRQLLGSKNPNVESRLKEVEQVLLGKGMTKQQIVDAISGLGPVAAAPTPAKIEAKAAADAAMPALPNLNANNAVTVTDPMAATPAVTQAVALPNVAGNAVATGVYMPGQDATRMQQASQVEPAAPTAQVPEPEATSTGETLYRQGLEALGSGDRDQAYELFLRAWEYQGEMDVVIRNQLKDKLVGMQSTNLRSQPSSSPALAQVSQEELAMRQRMMSEVTTEIAAAEANREVEPQVVAERLQTLRTRVSQANLDAGTRKQLLTIVDRQITAHQIYMNQNRAAIDQNLRNQQIEEQIALDQEQQTKIDQQVASLVETYNDLYDKGDFLEAEMVAKQVGALKRNSTIARLLIANARNARRIGEYEAIRESREDIFIDVMNDVDRAALGGALTDAQPLIFDAKRWEEVTKNRARQVRESEQGMSPAEQRIWQQLKQPVLVDFTQRPLAEVASTLSDMTGVMIHIDEAGLALEGYTPDTPVTLSLPSQISLRSALNLLLNTKNMDFQVRNEVLMITSARNTAQANVQRTYSVKDLVIPIPNFTTDYNSGMAGALRQAYETIGRGLLAQKGPAPGLAGTVELASASMNPNSPALGQINPLAGGNLPPQLGGGFGLGGSTGPVMGSPMMGGAPMSMGSPGAIGGGAAMADFDTLINLIQQTIDPDSWLANGGTSTLLPYPSNLSLVVSAPQTTHEKITDLLESLRRLQDLQVTIEVKFITLNDNFFERIGVDFDLRIDDNVRDLPLDDQGPSTTIGLSGAFDPASGVIPLTADFDIALTQNSFDSAVPAFGGFDQSAGASIGFAILSDLEMFFFMNAAQGDQRTNVLQAPRVTMFDGQFASITDTIQRPFVTSLIPVVGDFAVAQQPVIVVLNEGTVLNVQATVSPDKRFVRLTLNPSFSQIDRVDTFTFEGTRTTRSGSNVLDPDGNLTGETDDQEEIIAGTTVQQPSFASTNISTTVSVPDGGTILLGGIKRMREGRIERGVPILSKIPYVNRLFKNTAIGRETSTLMMTVTPRIIIQEEEEQKYGIAP
ncbi:MAG: general secretion pathway protein GspD [bacterium]|nr:general secretion pathway protein GspD [bacterium]